MDWDRFLVIGCALCLVYGKFLTEESRQVNSSCVQLAETTLKEMPVSVWENQTKTSLLAITRALTLKTEWSDEGSKVVVCHSLLLPFSTS